MDGQESPIFVEPRGEVPQLIPSGPIEGGGRHKIHRLRILQSCMCTLRNCISPSCVWLRLTNHITDRLQITDMKDLSKLTAEAELNDYVMAPLEEGVYGRARILDLIDVKNEENPEQKTKYALVMFIDEGITSWVSVECLAQMELDLSFHPWQAISAAIFKIRPRNGDQWNESTTEILRKILSKYEFIRIKVIHSSIDGFLNFHSIITVNMEGLHSMDDKIGHSIAYELVRNTSDVQFDRSMFNACDQQLYSYTNALKDRQFVMPYETWKNHFPFSTRYETLPEDCYLPWNESGVGPQVEVVDADLLAQYFQKGSFLVNVEGSHTKSPYEFYARPLLVKDLEIDELENLVDGLEKDNKDLNLLNQYNREDDAMLTANDELQKLAHELNTFYGQINNRKRINVERVKHSLENGKRVYGIAKVENELTESTGLWQRVEVIAIKEYQLEVCDRLLPENSRINNYFCRIRFLDSGGSEVRILWDIFEIHPSHCQRAPMCLQMCMFGIEPKPLSNNKKWSEDANKFFRQHLREDVPIALNVMGRLNKSRDGQIIAFDQPAYLLPNVIFVNHIQIRGGNTNHLDLMLKEEGYAESVLDGPVPLP